MRDDVVGVALERLALPLEDPRFFDRLRAGLREDERRSARRWRLATIALSVLAAAAIAAAAAVATARGGGAVVDRTFSCAVTGGLPGVPADAWSRSDARQAGLRVGSGASGLLSFDGSDTGFVLDAGRCRRGGGTVTLDPGALPLVAAFGPGYLRFHARCFPAGRLLVRVRLALDREGRPTRAVVSMRSAADARQLAVVRWQPALVEAYAGPGCPAG